MAKSKKKAIDTGAASALDAIHSAYDDQGIAERALKDHRGDALRRAKENLEAVDDAVKSSEGCDAADYGERLMDIQEKWKRYDDDKSADGAKTSELSKALKDAKDRFEASIKESRQVGLFG